MFCPNCGNADQTSDSYCRNCGELLTDMADKFSVIMKALGLTNPHRQITAKMIVDLATSIVGFLLLVFLNGYFDAQQIRTGESPPTVIYLVYTFIAITAGWQFLNFLFGLRLNTKAGKPRRPESSGIRGETPKTLPEADFENIIPPSVTEETTRPLERTPRNERRD